MKSFFHASPANRIEVLVATVAFFLLSDVTHAAASRINKDNPNDSLAAKIYKLPNELTVYLSENKQTPRFEANIVVRAGSKHDPADSTGLAHYLEHMLFKGTKKLGTTDFESESKYLNRIQELYESHFNERDEGKRKEIYKEINAVSQLAARFAIPNEIDKLYGSLGENGLNAHTSHEETVYKINLPSNRLLQWAIIESDRFQNPVFRLFQPELEIVYEEKNQMMDSKEAILHEAVGKVLFKKHPYGQQSTIGEIEHLKNPSLKNMYSFFEQYYVPNNCAIVISGDIDEKAALRIIEAEFASWKPRPLPNLPTWEDPKLKGAERVTIKYQGEEYVLLAFKLPPKKHIDTDALKLIDMVLDNAVAGLININLNQQQRVRRAGSSPELLNDHGIHYFWGIPKKGQTLKEVEDLLLAQIDLIKQGKFEDWIIPAIITDFKKNKKSSLESDAARVAVMRESFLSYTSWDDTIEEIDRLARLTKQDLVKVANKYYGSNFVAGYRVDAQHQVPNIQKPEIEKIALDPSKQSDFGKSVLKMPIPEIQPSFVEAGRDYQKVEIRKGINLYHSANPLNDLFTLTFSIDIGSRSERRLSLAARMLDKSGTEKLSAAELKQEWYKLGTDFSLVVGETESVITLSGLDENLQKSLSLLKQVLTNPKSDAATLQELKQITLAQRADQKKDFRSIAVALSQFHRFGTNSPILNALSTAELQSLGVTELHGLTKNLLKHHHAVSYAGRLAYKDIQNLLLTWYADANLKPTPPIKPLETVHPPKDQILLVNKEMSQSIIRLEFGTRPYQETAQPSQQLFNEYFSGGMGGIVFQELRESRALAYSANAMMINGTRSVDESAMIAQMSCQADKTREAIEAFLGLLNVVPLSTNRFVETKSAILSRYRTTKMGFREILGSVRSWERLGLSSDPRPSRFANLTRSTLDNIADFHTAEIKGKPYLISIVGSTNRIGTEKLAQLGSVQEVEIDRIFPN